MQDDAEVQAERSPYPCSQYRIEVCVRVHLQLVELPGARVLEGLQGSPREKFELQLLYSWLLILIALVGWQEPEEA